jgi:hypothetical protein
LLTFRGDAREAVPDPSATFESSSSPPGSGRSIGLRCCMRGSCDFAQDDERRRRCLSWKLPGHPARSRRIHPCRNGISQEDVGASRRSSRANSPDKASVATAGHPTSRQATQKRPPVNARYWPAAGFRRRYPKVRLLAVSRHPGQRKEGRRRWYGYAHRCGGGRRCAVCVGSRVSTSSR